MPMAKTYPTASYALIWDEKVIYWGRYRLVWRYQPLTHSIAAAGLALTRTDTVVSSGLTQAGANTLISAGLALTRTDAAVAG